RRILFTSILAALLTMTAFMATGPVAVEAATGELSASCSSPLGPQNVDIPYDVTASETTIQPGEQVTVSYTTDYPSTVTSIFNIEFASVTWPMPDAVESIDAVTITDEGSFTV